MSAAILDKKLAQVRAQITGLQARRSEVEGAPLSRAERAAALRQHLDALSSRWRRALVYQIGQFGQGEVGRPFEVAAGQSVDLAPLLAALVGTDALMQALAPCIAMLPEGMSAADKTKRLADIDAELLRLAHSEQDLIDSAEQAGVFLPYRADADPAIVLRVRSAA